MGLLGPSATFITWVFESVGVRDCGGLLQSAVLVVIGQLLTMWITQCTVNYDLILLLFNYSGARDHLLLASNNNNNNNNNNTLFNEGNIIYWLPSSLQYGPP